MPRDESSEVREGDESPAPEADDAQAHPESPSEALARFGAATARRFYANPT